MHILVLIENKLLSLWFAQFDRKLHGRWVPISQNDCRDSGYNCRFFLSDYIIKPKKQDSVVFLFFSLLYRPKFTLSWNPGLSGIRLWTSDAAHIDSFEVKQFPHNVGHNNCSHVTWWISQSHHHAMTQNRGYNRITFEEIKWVIVVTQFLKNKKRFLQYGSFILDTCCWTLVMTGILR